MMKKITIVAGISAMLFATACKTKDLKMNVEQKQLVNNKKEVVYQVASGQMHRDGYKFYLSVNNVWLTKEVPTKYLER